MDMAVGGTGLGCAGDEELVARRMAGHIGLVAYRLRCGSNVARAWRTKQGPLTGPHERRPGRERRDATDPSGGGAAVVSEVDEAMI
jgi:hypothetical protein